MMRQAQIWISAVLYLALGVIVISLILAASIPVIDKLKDRNNVAETKELLLTLDDTIRIVGREGPGSRRELTPLTLTKGKLFIEDDQDVIRWELRTSAVILELGVNIREGPLSLLLAPTPVKEEYLMTVVVNYTDVFDLQLDSAYQSPFSGHYSAMISHSGAFSTSSRGETIPLITIRVV